MKVKCKSSREHDPKKHFCLYLLTACWTVIFMGFLKKETLREKINVLMKFKTGKGRNACRGIRPATCMEEVLALLV